MLRLLIIDDEPMIQDGLVQLFQSVESLELEIFSAGSAMRGLRIMEQNKIDIVLTDIRMPEMSGLELFEAILDRWPRCKVVFLSGYNDFSYVQQVLRRGGVDYVLKMDGDEQIVQAVEKAAQALSQELDSEQIMAQAQRSLRELLPMRQQEYIAHLLLGEPFTEDGLQQRFDDLELPFSADQPLHMALVRVDRWEATMKPSERALLSYALGNIAQEVMDWAYGTSIEIEGGLQIWLSQSKEGDGELLWSHALEAAQQAVGQYLRLELSISAAHRLHWKDMGMTYDRLRQELHRSSGIGQAISFLRERNTSAAAEEAEHVYEVRARLKRFVFLETYLDNGQQEEWLEALAQLTVGIHHQRTPSLVQLEVFHKLSALILAAVNRWDAQSIVDDPIVRQRLLQLEAHHDWEDIRAFFAEMAGALWAWRRQGQEDQSREMVDTLHRYIEVHLAADLSLSTLAQIVYLNPAYLSRVYKRMTGIGLSDYVTDRRLQKAKELLRASDKQVQEVAAAVGFDSPSYFARLFKRATRMTPHEYRESGL